MAGIGVCDDMDKYKAIGDEAAWTTYLHGPSTDKMGGDANFIRSVLQIERSVNGHSVYQMCFSRFLQFPAMSNNFIFHEFEVHFETSSYMSRLTSIHV